MSIEGCWGQNTMSEELCYCRIDKVDTQEPWQGRVLYHPEGVFCNNDQLTAHYSAYCTVKEINGHEIAI